jgi:hypothetical protein
MVESGSVAIGLGYMANPYDGVIKWGMRLTDYLSSKPHIIIFSETICDHIERRVRGRTEKRIAEEKAST